MGNPTKAQIEFVEAIARVLNVDLPMEYTVEGYSDFIKDYVDAYGKRVIEKRRDEYRGLW